MIKQEIQIVPHQFAKASAPDVGEAHLSLGRSVVARRTFRHVGRDAAGSEHHLVVESAFWIYFVSHKPIAERLCAQLDDVGEHPAVQPEVSEGVCYIYCH